VNLGHSKGFFKFAYFSYSKFPLKKFNLHSPSAAQNSSNSKIPRISKLQHQCIQQGKISSVYWKALSSQTQNRKDFMTTA